MIVCVPLKVCVSTQDISSCKQTILLDNGSISIVIFDQEPSENSCDAYCRVPLTPDENPVRTVTEPIIIDPGVTPDDAVPLVVDDVVDEVVTVVLVAVDVTTVVDVVADCDVDADPDAAPDPETAVDDCTCELTTTTIMSSSDTDDDVLSELMTTTAVVGTTVVIVVVAACVVVAGTCVVVITVCVVVA
jgi:hypothetical protein